MMAVPSPRLLAWAVGLSAASMAVLAFPGSWPLLLTANLTLAGAALLDLLVTPPPRRLRVTRLAPDPLSVLREDRVTLIVRNGSRADLWVRIREGTPPSFHPSTEEVTGKVPAQGEVHLEYTVRPSARGLYPWGLAQMRYRSLLGLWEKRLVVPAEQASRVYPNLVLLEQYHLLARSNHLPALGIRRVRQRGSGWEFESLRDYVSGDDVRLLDWKATARRSRLIVRNQQAERNQTLLLLLDTGRLMNAEVEGAAKLDHAVSTALVLAHVALARGDRVGLCTFSHRVHHWVPPRGHLSQNRLLAETLYDLKGDFTESDHGRALRLLGARHPKRALLVLITDFVDAQTSADMTAHLRLTARRHLVLFTAVNDPFLERAARSVPDTDLEGFRKAAALELLQERREVLEGLRQGGMHVLDVAPTDLGPPLLNRYLEIAFRGEL
jgi:uncharacterized protein (DUF58 family)